MLQPFCTLVLPRFDDAAALYEEAADVARADDSPDVAAAVLRSALGSAAAGDARGAEAAFEEAVSRAPESADAWREYAFFLEETVGDRATKGCFHCHLLSSRVFRSQIT